MKKNKETYLDYKKRVIDTKSESFCGAKWYNATIWLSHIGNEKDNYGKPLGAGMTASCHHPPAHKIDLEEVKKNPKALHNTKHKKEMRRLMQKGIKPDECDYCWKIEGTNKDVVSDRVFKTVIYSDEENQEAMNTPYDEDINLKTLELAFDRTCNFACSYCNASFSTTWAKDISKNGAYQDLTSDGAGAFQQDGSWANQYYYSKDNPAIQAFWKWWPELTQTLKELRITGGEPLLAIDTWRMFTYFQKYGFPKQMKFSINSNLCVKDDIIDKMIEKSKFAEKFDIYTSMEATNKQAEYIRDGLDYNKWFKNVEKVCENANLDTLHVMMTINSLCLFSITDLLDQMLRWKEKYGKHFPVWSVNILRFPSFMSPLSLPQDIKEDRRLHLLNWLKSNESNPYMTEMEYEGILRLINYLDVVKTPHDKTSERPKLHRDFKSFYQQYDKRRSKSIYVFPEILTEWFDNIPNIYQDKKQKLIDGDATKM